MVLAALAPFLILLPFVSHDDGPSWTVGPVQLSLVGIVRAAMLACKTLALVLLVLVLLATAPLPATFKAAQSLRVPALLVQLALLTYCYVFVLAAELGRLRVALRVRGFRNRANRHSYRTAGHLAGTLLVRGYEQAERVEQARRCRGFDGRFRTLREYQTRPADVGGFLLIVGISAGLVFFDLVRSP
jgi:cobalt/nickel transport system permease protein